MHYRFWKRTAGLVLALGLVLAAVPAALAAEFTLIELKEDHVILDETVFTHSGEEIRPNVTVRVEEQLLTLDRDYTLEYADNIEVGTGKVIVKGIATASEAVGYTGTVEIPFTIEAEEPELIPILAENVQLEGTEFVYTGSYIEPKVTVTVDGKELTREQDYNLRYHSNIGVGTATAVITGREEAGYTGTVNVNFTIVKDPEQPAYQMVTLTPENVTMDGSRFPYTGKAIEPKVTVTVDGKALKLGQDYSLTYENNIRAGTGTAVIKGIATASETLGYTGEVRMNFTIVEEPAENKPVEYKITKGDKATWYRESEKTLSFTADGKREDLKAVKIDGKVLKETYYTLETGSATVTLKNSALKQLKEGSYTITLVFADGEAEGTFRVRSGLDTTNPETGDAAILWFGLLGLSVMGLGAALLLRKKYV